MRFISKKKLSDLFLFFVIGVFLMLGMRAVDYVLPKRDLRILVCLEEKNEIKGACLKWEDYFEKTSKSTGVSNG